MSTVSVEKAILRSGHLTLFQKRILVAALRIPEGETRTYKWVAERAGYPRAARAAGRALAKNPYAPEVPCHRVISSDGSIGGYSGKGGPRRKRQLLEKEKRGRG